MEINTEIVPLRMWQRKTTDEFFENIAVCRHQFVEKTNDNPHNGQRKMDRSMESQCDNIRHTCCILTRPTNWSNIAEY